MIIWIHSVVERLYRRKLNLWEWGRLHDSGREWSQPVNLECHSMSLSGYVLPPNSFSTVLEEVLAKA